MKDFLKNAALLTGLHWLRLLQILVLARVLVWLLPGVDVLILIAATALVVIVAEMKTRYSVKLLKTDPKRLTQSMRAALKTAGNTHLFFYMLAYLFFVGALFMVPACVLFLASLPELYLAAGYEPQDFTALYRGFALFLGITLGVVSGLMAFVEDLARARQIKWLPYLFYAVLVLVYLVFRAWL